MPATQPRNPETFRFKAEAQQLLKLVVGSLYTQKDVFLRELVANASDALDRLRIEMLTRTSLSPDGEPRIIVTPNKDRRTLKVEDNGIGMSRDEVVSNVGTIAKSGTTELLEILQQAPPDHRAEPLKGQFGVGFYSSFMVAERVEILTRRAGEEEATHWSSTGDDHYVVQKAEREGHGTSVVLHLKPVHQDNGVYDYTDRGIIERTIKQHCDFVGHPIALITEKELAVDEKGPQKSDAAAWEQEEKVVNAMQPIWAQPPADVNAEEYGELYKSMFGDWTEPFETIHQHGEGAVEYHALLFIPSQPPHGVYYAEVRPAMRLYASRMLVMEDCGELLPRYLRFMRGIVDSPDLPLNVSRQRLQNDRNLSLIRRALIHKVLQVLSGLLVEDRDRYVRFWRQFGQIVKEGVGRETNQREMLHRLLMFESSYDKGQCVTLQEYVDRMQPGQDVIYYLTGPSRGVIENSPTLEALRERKFEVLYLSDPVDEFVVGSLAEFAGRNLRSAGKGVIDLGKEDEKKAGAGVRGEEFGPFLAALEQRLTKWIKEVRLSERLIESPVVLVGAEHDHSPNLERMLSTGTGDAPRQRRIMELNAKHVLVSKLRERFDAAPNDPEIGDYSELLFGWALIAEGSDLYNAVRYKQLVADLMGRDLEAATARPDVAHELPEDPRRTQ